jgi:hypothetical protein
MILFEAVVAYLNRVSYHSSGQTEENHKKLARIAGRLAEI